MQVFHLVFLGCIRCTQIFPGRDYVDQIKVILSKIGSPSEEDKAFITNKKARDHVKSLGKFKKQPWASLLPEATAGSLDLLDQILHFDPAKRLSAADCLAHPWLEEHHDPGDEIEQPCSTAFTFDSDFSFEDESQVRALLDLVVCFGTHISDSWKSLRVATETDQTHRELPMRVPGELARRDVGRGPQISPGA